MISVHQLPDLSPVQDLKSQYLQSLTAPMDGMWDAGFTDPAAHFEMWIDGERAGYYAADNDHGLLQFYVRPGCEPHSRALFEHILAQDSLKHAVVSTIDPPMLSLCLDHQKKVTVHTYLYELSRAIHVDQPDERGIVFRAIESTELDRTVAFQLNCLGGDPNLRGWLEGYSANLIERDELFVLCRGEVWLGLGEQRKSDSQPGIVDLGMMVGLDHRGEGLATYILGLLTAKSIGKRLQPICSTTVENRASQIAIERAGYVSQHRIMNVSFEDAPD